MILIIYTIGGIFQGVGRTAGGIGKGIIKLDANEIATGFKEGGAAIGKKHSSFFLCNYLANLSSSTFVTNVHRRRSY